MKENSINQIFIFAIPLFPTANYFKLDYLVLNINDHFKVIYKTVKNFK